jgi:hypothetical protein
LPGDPAANAAAPPALTAPPAAPAPYAAPRASERERFAKSASLDAQADEIKNAQSADTNKAEIAPEGRLRANVTKEELAAKGRGGKAVAAMGDDAVRLKDAAQSAEVAKQLAKRDSLPAGGAPAGTGARGFQPGTDGREGFGRPGSGAGAQVAGGPTLDSLKAGEQRLGGPPAGAGFAPASAGGFGGGLGGLDAAGASAAGGRRLPPPDVASRPKPDEVREKGESDGRLSRVKESAALPTLYFNPQLVTDANGRVTFEFTMPEGESEYRLLVDALGKGRIGSVQQVIVGTGQPAAGQSLPAAAKEAK